jgi:hypothetical protein
VIGLAHALGLLAIAEGIESKGQLDSIRRLGCDLAQGYLFARPVTADQIARVLSPQAGSAKHTPRRRNPIRILPSSREPSQTTASKEGRIDPSTVHNLFRQDS